MFTDYQFFAAAVSAANLLLALAAFNAARQKASSDRIDRLERDVRAALKAHDDQLARMVNEDHLADVYKDLKGISQQVHTLIGQQVQMNENLRLLLAQLVRGDR